MSWEGILIIVFIVLVILYIGPLTFLEGVIKTMMGGVTNTF